MVLLWFAFSKFAKVTTWHIVSLSVCSVYILLFSFCFGRVAGEVLLAETEVSGSR